MARKVALKPLELSPEWLTEGPFTADDLRCTTPASTIFRMSFTAADPLAGLSHRESVVTSRTSSASDDECESDAGSDRSTFLWDDDEDDDEDDEDDTIEESDVSTPRSKHSPLSSPSLLPSLSASPVRTPEPSATPSHSRNPSAGSTASSRAFNACAPWFLQVDPTCIAALDDQLLQSPLDAFADLCYAQAVRASPASDVRGGYSWRRQSRLLSACLPDLPRPPPPPPDAHTDPAQIARESESESDSDSEHLASPEQPAPVRGWACAVYQPGAEHHFARESPYRPYTSDTLISKPLPALPSRAPSHAHSFSLPPPSPARCSPPPPPLYMPPPAVSQAQLAFLFASARPRPDEGVHFFPAREQQQQAKAARRGPLRLSTDVRAGGGGGTAPEPWSPAPRPSLLQRGLAGIRAGLSH